MKTSQTCKGRWLLAASAFALAASVIVAPGQADTTGTTQQQYQPWAGAAGQQLKNLIAELKSKIAAAEQSQAASPDFLADLKALAAKYEAMQTPGQNASGSTAGTQVFSDTFSDGNYTGNPAWKVSAGTWTVDPDGTNRGLNSKVRPQKLNLNNVLGALLDTQSGATNQNQFASIYTPVKIPNAFALKVTLTSKDRQGALNLGVYQGASGSTLYRMVYQPGAAPGIAIQKVTSSGATTLGSSKGAVNLEDGKAHTLILSRDAQGAMKVTLDNQSVATAKDSTITGDMTGLLFINSGGAYYLRDVTVTSN
jgi:hypothetical protein